MPSLRVPNELESEKTARCVSCSKVVREGELVFGDAGMICVHCEYRAEKRKERTASLKTVQTKVSFYAVVLAGGGLVPGAALSTWDIVELHWPLIAGPFFAFTAAFSVFLSLYIYRARSDPRLTAELIPIIVEMEDHGNILLYGAAGMLLDLVKPSIRLFVQSFREPSEPDPEDVAAIDPSSLALPYALSALALVINLGLVPYLFMSS